MSVGNRLREALQLRGRSVRWLHLNLKDRVKGARSYSSVHSYVKNDSRPGSDFLRAAAEALDVRRDWLIYGEGKPIDPRAEQAKRTGLYSDSPAEAHEMHVGALRHVVPVLADVPLVVQTAFLETLERYVLGFASHGRPVRQAVYEHCARELWAFVDLPHNVRGFRAGMQSDEYVNYAVAMLHALSLAMPDPGRGSLSDVSLGAYFARTIDTPPARPHRHKRQRKPSLRRKS